MTEIPVVLFVHRRPDILQRVLDCFRADRVPLLLVFSDGPRSEREADDVAAVRRLVRSIDWCAYVVEESAINLGLGTSIKRGVTAALRTYDAAIFYEDDIVSVPGAYRYLVAALHQYADDPRVMSVTAWTHPRITPSGLDTGPYFDGKAECWAWGTWSRAWDGMDAPALAIMEDCASSGFDIERYGSDLPKMAQEASMKNLWAVGWFYHHMRRRGLCLRPPWSMAEQICWDESRSTTSTSTPEMMAWANPPLRSSPPIPSEWPEPVEHPLCAELWRRAIDG